MLPFYLTGLLLGVLLSSSFANAHANLSQNSSCPKSCIITHPEKKIVTPPTKGQFKLTIKPSPSAEYNEVVKYVNGHSDLSKIIAQLNQLFKIPYDIPVVLTLTDKGEYYLTDKKTIFLDYKMMRNQLTFYERYHPGESTDNKRNYFNNVTRFFLYHEVGHALIDVYHLPVLGQQEDAADSFAAIVSLAYVSQGFQVLVDAADFFYLLDRTYGTDATSYWDEHDLDRQRYYRLLCFAYGKEPIPVEKRIQYYYKGSLANFIKERSGYCHYEYNDAYFAWMLVLQPYLKLP